MRLILESIDLSKADWLPLKVGGPHTFSWRSEENKKGLHEKKKPPPPAWLPWTRTLMFFCLLTWTEIVPLQISSLPLVSSNLSASIITKANFLLVVYLLTQKQPSPHRIKEILYSGGKFEWPWPGNTDSGFPDSLFQCGKSFMMLYRDRIKKYHKTRHFSNPHWKHMRDFSNPHWKHIRKVKTKQGKLLGLRSHLTTSVAHWLVGKQGSVLTFSGFI